MWWYLAAILVFMPMGAFAQCLGIDAPPPQAASAGYNCQTYRWGSGDTISEIDTGQTYAPGYKLYYGTAQVNGHATVGGDFTVTPVTGAIVVKTTETCPGPNCGAFALNTCGVASPGTNYTVGQLFRNGWYVEAVMHWDSTGHPGIQTGFYGLGWSPSTFPLTGNLQWEADDPDAYALDQQLSFWGGGTLQGMTNNPINTRHGDATVQTGNKFGVLSTTTGVSWWYNDTANGAVDFAGSYSGFFNPMEVYNTSFCFGTESTSAFPVTYDSIKIWQAGGAPPPPSGGGGLGLWKMLHRR